MKFSLRFSVKGKQYRNTYNNISDAESAKRYVTKRGATDVEICAIAERTQNENF